MPSTAWRIYVGARNTSNRTFLPNDDRTIKNILDRYFKGWTLQEAKGSWDGKTEESRIITVTDDPTRVAVGAGSSPIESCAAQIKGHLAQTAVMYERGGTVSIL